MKHIALASLLLATLSAPLSATPSGLNNIPTADTTPMGTVVIQAFSNFGKDVDSDFNMGFKTGLEFYGQKFEFGADSYIVPDKGGPVVLQANTQAMASRRTTTPCSWASTRLSRCWSAISCCAVTSSRSATRTT